MTKSKTLLTLITSLFLFVLSFVSLPVYGSTPTEPVTLTPQEFATLKTNFDTLESTINNQLTTINKIEMQLKIAKLTEERIDRSIELNSRTENSIDRSTELTSKARADAERAKNIIGESRSILKRAEERNTQSQDGTTQK